jgi:hypothetical protein
MLLLNLIANENFTTIKTSCIQQSNYGGKSPEQLRDGHIISDEILQYKKM